MTEEIKELIADPRYQDVHNILGLALKKIPKR